MDYYRLRPGKQGPAHTTRVETKRAAKRPPFLYANPYYYVACSTWLTPRLAFSFCFLR